MNGAHECLLCKAHRDNKSASHYQFAEYLTNLENTYKMSDEITICEACLALVEVVEKSNESIDRIEP
jgi:hypothetical protein